jgi:hypothetical protein
MIFVDNKNLYAKLYLFDKAVRCSMGQITIYIDTETEKKMMRIVKDKKVSKSKWIASLIREKAAAMWPESVASMAGAWSDLPEAEDLRKEIGRDAEREPL